jgi:hypothetical protein
MQLLKYYFVFILIFVSGLLCAQSNISLRTILLGFHPGENPNSNIYVNKLDANGAFCIEPGLIASYEAYLFADVLSFRFLQSFYVDAAAMPAGFTGLEIKRRIMMHYRNSMHLAAGPSVIYRNDWNKIDGYSPTDKYKLNGRWQYKYYFLAELEYDFYISQKSDLNLSFLYGYSGKGLAINFGYRYWISTKIVNKKKCHCLRIGGH